MVILEVLRRYVVATIQIHCTPVVRIAESLDGVYLTGHKWQTRHGRSVMMYQHVWHIC